MRPSAWFGSAMLVAGALVSGCAAGAAGPGVATAGGSAQHPSASPTPSLSPQEAALKFAQCMRQHGVNMPDPHFGSGGQVSIRINGGGLSPQRMQQAQQACKQYAPGAAGVSPGKISPQDQERALKFAQCMRDHGVNMPDPSFSGGHVEIRTNGRGGPGTVGSGGNGPDPNSPTFQAAIKACNAYLGGKGGPGFSVSGGPK